MLDYQRIIDDVRSSMACNEVQAADTLARAAADMLVAVDEVNERLRKCGQLLRNGLRSEAIQLADVPPNLLDAVAALDLPERAEWETHLARYNIIAPPQLSMEIAAQLNEAYAHELPLVDLLKQHRLLAMSSAPLSQRIAVLRNLAERDGLNPIWSEDLRAYEVERLRQLQMEAAEAINNKEVERLRELEREVNSGPWLVTPPKAVVTFIQDGRHRLERKWARHELESMEQSLNEAHAQLDVDEARLLRQRWQELAPTAEMNGDEWSNQLLSHVEPAFQWLNEEDAREEHAAQTERAIQELEVKLDDPTSSEHDLERAAHHISRLGGEFPELLLQRYQHRMYALRLAVTRKRRLIIVSAVTVLVAASAGIGWFINRTLYHRQVQTQAEILTQYIEEEKLDEGTKFVESLKERLPKVAAESSIVDLELRLNGLIDAERERHSQFSKAIQEAQGSGGEPATIDTAKKYAKTPEDTATIDQIIADRRLRLAQERAAQEQAGRKKIDDFSAKLLAFESQVRSENHELGALLDNHKVIQGELTGLVADINRGASTLAGLTGPLQARLETLKAQLDRRGRWLTAETAVNESIGDAAKYVAALRHAAEKFPETARATDFQKVADEAAIWGKLMQSAVLRQTWSDYDLKKITPGRAKRMIETTRKTLKENGAFPWNDGLEQALRPLESIVAREEDSKPILAPFVSYCRNGNLSTLGRVVTTKGVYYTPGKPELSENGAGKVQFRYLEDFALGTGKMESFFPREVTSQDALAPHCVLAKELLRLAGEVKEDNWESSMYKMLVAIKEQPDVESCVRLTLLEKLLEIATTGSYPMRVGFAPHLKAVNSANFNKSAIWINPLDRDANAERRNASSILESLPAFESGVKTVAEMLQQKPTARVPQFRWIGRLTRTADSKWSVITANNLSDRDKLQGDLCVVLESIADVGKYYIPTIGTIEAGKTAVKATESHALVEGRPVFLTTP